MSTRVLKSTTLIVVLMATLVSQAIYRRSLATSFDDLVGPVHGQYLPTAPLQLMSTGEKMDLSTSLRSKGTCSLVVFMAVDCVVCRRMRRTWPQFQRETFSRLEVNANITWIFGDERSRVTDFLAGVPLGEIAIATALAPKETVQKFGVFGTPISYLTDQNGIFIASFAGDRLPPDSLLERRCAIDQ